jgi:polyphenol oxidase
MKDNFEILKTSIFPEKKVLAGVTKRNLVLFPENGFTISDGTDNPSDEIIKNRKQLANVLDIDYLNLKFQRQVHETNIQVVDDNSTSGKETDGMITDEKGIILNITIADCTAILVYDPINEAVGAFHSGWRGTKENIAKKGIQKMNDNFKTKPEYLLIYLSPCASGQRYEVEWDVAQYFPETTNKINDKKYLFDNKKQIISQLLALGVKEENIEASPICTIADENYHSYRRDKENSGRMSAFIGMIK